MKIHFTAIIAAVVLILMAGCEGKSERIPSYIQIDSAVLSVTPTQGSNVHEIAAVQVYVNTEYLGTFEMPCKVPVLYEGKCKLTLIPAVRFNASRSKYDIYRSLALFDTTINLTPGSISLSPLPVFKFKTAATMVWVEDFEDKNSSLIKFYSDKGDTSFVVENVPFNLNGRFGGKTTCLKAVMKGSDTQRILDLASFKSFKGLPVDGTDVNLEFDLNSPVPVQVALVRTTNGGRQYVPYVIINPTESKWKHFNINLVFELATQPADLDIQILISPTKPAGTLSDQEIFIDNIRLNHLN
jgi:hypothetical protein